MWCFREAEEEDPDNEYIEHYDGPKTKFEPLF